MTSNTGCSHLYNSHRIEVKVLPFDPPHSGIVHDNQDGVMTGKVRVFLDAKRLFFKNLHAAFVFRLQIFV